MVPKKDDRIELLSMHDDPNPIPAGTRGTVRTVYRNVDYGRVWHQVAVTWDNGRGLMLCIPPDRIQILEKE